MRQLGPPTYQIVDIPISNAAHFRTSTEKNNPEGVSILRRAWRSWDIKHHLEEVEAIGVERDLTGLPMITTPEGLDIWNPNDENAAATLARAEEIVRLIRLDKYQGLVLPFAWEFKLQTTSGQRPHNTSDIISRWDQRIAVTLLADMLLIGHERVGSFALVQSKTRLFSSALESYAARVAGVFNRQLIPRLMILNGIPQEYWPTMRFGPVETPALKDMADYLTALSGTDIVIDEAMALYLRDIAQLPPPKKGDKAVKTFEDKLEEQDKQQQMFEKYKQPTDGPPGGGKANAGKERQQQAEKALKMARGKAALLSYQADTMNKEGKLKKDLGEE
jgi:hypothetical protein